MEGSSRGLQQYDLPLRLSAAVAGGLLSPPRPGQGLAERGAPGLQPLLLRLRRSPLPAAHAPLHRRQLHGRPVGRPQGRYGADHSGGSGPAGLVQVRRLFLLQPGQGVDRPASAGGHPPHRHLLLHLPGPLLRAGRVPGPGPGPAQPPPCGPLHLPLPPAGGRPHRPLHHRGRGDPHPAGDGLRLLCRGGPVPLRPGQEDAAGQPAGPHGRRDLRRPPGVFHRLPHLAGRHRLHRPDLL